MEEKKDPNANMNEEPVEQKDQPPKAGLTAFIDGINPRSALLMLIAGLYVVYLGFNLCKGYIAKEEGTSLGFFFAGALFILLGGFFAYAGGKASMKAQKEKKEAAEAEMKNSEAGETAPEENKPMSIAERAAMTAKEESTEEETE